jgi:hypothetical protein
MTMSGTGNRAQRCECRQHPTFDFAKKGTTSNTGLTASEGVRRRGARADEPTELFELWRSILSKSWSGSGVGTDVVKEGEVSKP